ncbi:polyamine ABC transporter substrate-binding protein [Microvirga sp. GCM10011540]|uniref:polyamine ABC transporter substrate-binding protein n=1 Tax=Microvirga sp. GCM10011540 TaxID=3317338 RepID=UPI00361BFB7F
MLNEEHFQRKEPEMSTDKLRSRISRRLFLGGSAVGALALGTPYVNRGYAQDKFLYVNTWGGVWEQAVRKYIFDPFTAETGVQIRTVSPVSFAKLAAQVRTGTYEFDVTTLGAGELIRANNANLVAPAEGSPLDPTRLWDGAVFMNGVGFDCFSTVIAYRKDKFPNGGPQNWAEFWDVEKFPGSRSLQRYAARVLPIALLADGVPVDQLYPLDIDRAFKSLDRIKPHIRVWWTAGAQSQQILRDREVDLIGIWQGRCFELIQQNVPVAMTWNQAEIDKGYWVVAKGTPRAELAWQFIQSASLPERQAGFAKAALSSPLNPKAFDFIEPEAAQYMPTAPQNYSKTFEQDIGNFGADIEETTRRFEDWLTA